MSIAEHLVKLAPVNLYFDKALVLASVTLIVMGYLMVSSASLHLGAKLTGNVFYYPLRQLIHIILGVIAGWVVCMIPMDFWEKTGQALFFAGLFLLVLVLIPGLGVKVNGSTRWLSLPGIRIQVSEVVKFIVVIYMAGFVTRHHDLVKESAYGLVKPLLLLSSACGLLLLEPDMGSAVVILTIAMGVLFLSGARIQQFLLLVIGVVAAGVLAVVYSGYRTARFTSFLHPWEDPFGNGFQLVQALISFGRGEWLGVGLGSGVQKLFYLPEAHTDFLFSVIAEELGFVGVLSVIVLFAVIVWRAFVIGMMAEQLQQKFCAFIAYGLGIWFAFQAFVNMGVNMGLLPTKGLTLPFMSYGGGSMIVMCCAMAMLYRVNTEMLVLKKAEEQDMSKRIVIMAGGTGGHVFPALAVAHYLIEQNWQLSWIGTHKGMESRVIPEDNIEIDWLSVNGLRGKEGLALFKMPWMLLKACLEARKILQTRKPDVVLGMGGFVAGPGGLMAKIMGIPLVIHEQNRIPGTTNRLLSSVANKVLQAFPESFAARKKAIFTGNPLRQSFIQQDIVKSADTDDLHILVMGGSLGAQRLNEVIPEALALLDNVEVLHQTGAVMQQQVELMYKEKAINARVMAFIDDVVAAYSWADLVICRAGAMTVSEVAAMGLPSILIPYPYAIDDHQTANAHYLVDAGAGVMIAQQQLTVNSLVEQIEHCTTHLEAMAKAARQSASLNATYNVAEQCKLEAA